MARFRDIHGQRVEKKGFVLEDNVNPGHRKRANDVRLAAATAEITPASSEGGLSLIQGTPRSSTPHGTADGNDSAPRRVADKVSDDQSGLHGIEGTKAIEQVDGVQGLDGAQSKKVTARRRQAVPFTEALGAIGSAVRNINVQTM